MKILKQSAITGFAIICLVGGLAFPSDVQAQDSLLTYDHPDRPPTMEELVQWKEVFTYKVKFGFFKLGEVKTTIIKDTTYHGQKIWWLRTVITSNSGIPFVGEEENHYNTFMVETDSTPYTKLYWRDDVDENEFEAEVYEYDYENEKVYVLENMTPVDTLALTEPSSSGQLIFYYSRLFAGTGKNYRLPVYLEREKGYINAMNSTETVMRKYDAFDKPVETYFSEGDADIDGPFGFRGKYKAWYVADDLRVPAEAHAKVWLGNVKVQLIDYKKERR
ncbi:DUF3108 domain-containing protein [Fodinibius sp.]|uniref:DUF3108 domain-containing protein n=1 Tax=Fodinibius sp. TaxID=1872440 RepID=UPI002ACD605D|nr:DUF3108 domain-containing protein [Fodinibius sp.]MDZ7660722.1 DUF3108 domain-containing protein [Fodinibius sp.]